MSFILFLTVLFPFHTCLFSSFLSVFAPFPPRFIYLPAFTFNPCFLIHILFLCVSSHFFFFLLTSLFLSFNPHLIPSSLDSPLYFSFTLFKFLFFKIFCFSFYLFPFSLISIAFATYLVQSPSISFTCIFVCFSLLMFPLNLLSFYVAFPFLVSSLSSLSRLALLFL